MSKQEHITIITGQPANGKTTVGRLLENRLGFTCIEGDNFITPIGKTRLNNGTWDNIDRKIYLSRMAAEAVEAKLNHQEVVVADCLTTVWMREFLVSQITSLNQLISVGFILLERELSAQDIAEIAQKRASEGHALSIAALIRFRQLFEPWENNFPMVRLINPGNKDLNQLLLLTQKALSQLWK